MREAEIEYISEAVAICPYCDDPHDVPACGNSGEINCDCGETFYWSTEH